MPEPTEDASESNALQQPLDEDGGPSQMDDHDGVLDKSTGEDYELSAYSPFRVTGAAALLSLSNSEIATAKKGWLTVTDCVGHSWPSEFALW